MGLIQYDLCPQKRELGTWGVQSGRALCKQEGVRPGASRGINQPTP